MNAFEDYFAAWKQMQSEPWMRLRYELAQEYLRPHLPSAPARLLDVGGGNGFDSIPLARAGYWITILDPSAAMLSDAQAYAESLGVAAQVTCIQAAVDAVANQVPAGSFDLIFCHNVLQYVAAPAQALLELRACMAPGGLLSIINPNPASEALRLACQTYDLAQAAASIHATQRHIPTFDVIAQHYTHEQLAAWLNAAGYENTAYYGIRCVCDYLADNDRKRDPQFYAELYALEHTMGAIDPYRQIARFMHLIARTSAA